MSGKRFLDLAKLVNASRNIAKQHVELRSRQLDAFNKTSTLAKAAKNQTDRVTLTVQAAAALARRFNEERPSYTESQVQENVRTTAKAGAVKEQPNEDTAGGAQQLGQRSQEVAAKHPLPNGTFSPKEPPIGRPATPNVTPEQSEPLAVPMGPDRTDPAPKAQRTAEDVRTFQRQAESQIPSVTAAANTLKSEDRDRDIYYEPSTGKNIAYSSLPRAKIPKHIATEQETLSPRSEIDADVFHKTPQRHTEDEQVPKGVDVNIFHSTKVSDMLGVRKPSDHRRRQIRVGQPKVHSQDDIHPALRDSRDSSHVTAMNFERGATSANGSGSKETPNDMERLARDMAEDVQSNLPSASEPDPAPAAVSFQMRESRVPSSRFGRLWQYAGLGTSMALGAVSEGFRRATGGGTGGSLMLGPANMERLVAKLSRMRGAALKLGQMISFQDLKLLPKPIHEVLQRVQDSADYMPASQRDRVLASNLGKDWRELFQEFDDVPIAAASIGQVHRATLKSTGEEVAVKVQYPGVAASIDSDLNNLSILLTASRLLPKGLYLEKTIANARVELAWECDYIREAEMAERFRKLLADESDTFTVPRVIAEASGREVLTAELMHGIAVTKPTLNLSQEERDWIGTQILRLCLREITEFKFMQTDPNWTNFLYNRNSKRLELLDFGASREYPDEFVDPYIGILRAASKGDRVTIRDLSIQLGYLTGSESKAMRDAHIDSVLTLAEPFTESAPEVYDFKDQTITDRVRSLIPLMVRERLAPPPEETYSLHRKLSGAFLLCARLGSQVRCRDMFIDAIRLWQERKHQPRAE